MRGSTFVCILVAVVALPAGIASAAAETDIPLIEAPLGTWRVYDESETTPLFSGHSIQCDGGQRRWTDGDDALARIILWSCQTPNDAAVATWWLLREYSDADITTLTIPEHALLATRKASAGQESADDEAEVLLARSSFVILTTVEVSPGSRASASDMATAITQQQASALRGPSLIVEPVRAEVGQFGTAFLTIFVLLVLPIRFIRNPVALQRYVVRAGDPAWVDVTRASRRLRWGLRFRAFARFTVLLFIAGVAISRQVTAAALLMAAPCVWFGWIRPPRSSLRWRVRGAVASRPTRRLRTWISPVLSLLSTFTGVALLALLAITSALASLHLEETPMMKDGSFNPRYLDVTSERADDAIVALLVLVPFDDLLELSLMAALVLLAMAAGIRRLSRRLGMQDADRALKKDTRPPVLFLRSFRDDRLRMPSSLLGRTSFLERFSPLRLQPFEEVLVRHLHQLGPVVALAPPGTKLPRIGAAKLVIPGGDEQKWQQQIVEWAGRAQAVVVMATPSEMGGGLQWEIEYLAKDDSGTSILLVLAPHKRRKVARRWARFVAEARRHPELQGLAAYERAHSGAHVMALTPGSGWKTWGARTRSEWTYALAVAGASDHIRSSQHPVR